MLLIFLTLLSLISNANGIEQIHLSLTGKPSETYITWTALNKTRNNYINYGINNKFKEDGCYLNNTLTKIDTNRFNNDNFDKNGRITYIHYGLLTIYYIIIKLICMFQVMFMLMKDYIHLITVKYYNITIINPILIFI